MCRVSKQDNGCGVGDIDDPRSVKRKYLADETITGELLKVKNAELHELQAFMLSVPRAERKDLKVDIDVLDAQIKQISANHSHSYEVQRIAIALRDSIATNDPDAISEALQQLIKMSAGLTTITEEVFFYLISAGEGVISAMQQHLHHRGVIKAGFHALCNLFGGLKTLDNGDSVAKQWCSSEVGDMVVDAMGAFLEDRDVQFYGCRLINILAVTINATNIVEDLGYECENEVATACFTVSARVAVSKARRQHALDTEVTKWADCAMRLL